MGDNCFTMLGWFLPYIKMHQLWVYICPLSSEPLSHLPSHPTLLGCHRAQGWAPCAIQQIPTGYPFYTWSWMYVSMLLSQFAPPSPSTNLVDVCPQVCSLCLHQYHFYRFHIYSVIYNICFSDLLHCITSSRFIHLTRTDSTLFLLWLSNIPLHTCATSSLSIDLWLGI